MQCIKMYQDNLTSESRHNRQHITKISHTVLLSRQHASVDKEITYMISRGCKSFRRLNNSVKTARNQIRYQYAGL